MAMRSASGAQVWRSSVNLHSLVACSPAIDSRSAAL